MLMTRLYFDSIFSRHERIHYPRHDLLCSDHVYHASWPKDTNIHYTTRHRDFNIYSVLENVLAWIGGIGANAYWICVLDRVC
jgi:hypothetical protein